MSPPLTPRLLYLLTATVTIGQLLYSPALFFRANVRIKYKYKYNIPCVTLFIIPFSVRLSFLQGTQGWSKKENILAGSNPQLLLLHRQITYPKKSEHKENIIENGTSVHCVWPLGLQMTHRCTQIQEERGKRRQQRSELTRMVQGTIHLMQQWTYKHTIVTKRHFSFRSTWVHLGRRVHHEGKVSHTTKQITNGPLCPLLFFYFATKQLGGKREVIKWTIVFPHRTQ